MCVVFMSILYMERVAPSKRVGATQPMIDINLVIPCIV